MNAHTVHIGVGDRASLVRRGRRLEYFTIAYNSLEGLIAVVAGRILRLGHEVKQPKSLEGSRPESVKRLFGR